MEEIIRSIVERLKLVPHPEGGFFREIHRSDRTVFLPGEPGEAATGRSAGTGIYYLLAAGDFSAFHRIVRSDGLWHFYAGDPLELHLLLQNGRHETRILHGNLELGEPVAVVNAGTWQAARPQRGSRYALVGCTVSPGFEYADHEMADGEALAGRFPQHAALIRELTRT
jgi:predicted cupin superfamily sugar epimerase